jgi:uncharacterized protein (UPF0548 family)
MLKGYNGSVLLFREPSHAKIRHFLDSQRHLPFSYPEVGASRDGAPRGYGVNEHRGRLGTGTETFARAVEAIRHWKMYETGWTRLLWPDAPISEGTVIGILGRHLGLKSLNACRIAYVYEEDEPSHRRYGFAVGTLPGHVERGEERFTVEWQAADDAVFYEVFAFSRPAHPLVRLAQPLARRIQSHFAPDSLQSMANAVTRTQS